MSVKVGKRERERERRGGGGGDGDKTLIRDTVSEKRKIGRAKERERGGEREA